MRIVEIDEMKIVHHFDFGKGMKEMGGVKKEGKLVGDTFVYSEDRDLIVVNPQTGKSIKISLGD